jgi:integrase
MRGINKLSDRGVKAWARSAQPRAQISDGGGLHVTISKAGTPLWQIKYAFGGKHGLIYSAGAYPGVTLEGARVAREWVKTQLREGKNPNQSKAVNRAAAVASSDDTFAAVTSAWLAKRKESWSAIHYEKSSRALERDVLPTLGKLPVAQITPVLVSGVIEAIDGRGVRETASKILQHVDAVFRLAQARGLRQDNPAAPVREVLSKRKATRSRPAALEWKALGAILRSAEAASLSPTVRLAHRLCAFSVARISNIVQASWPEFDLETSPPLWLIPRSKMKVQGRDHDHKIVLGDTIAAELREWRRVAGGKGYLFPSRTNGAHVTRESIEKAYRVTMNLEGKHTPHGWRAAFSTLARDNGFEREVVELTLDHIHDNDVARAYDRGERLKQRIELMNWWDAQLRQAEHGAEVLPLRAYVKLS